ncbi:ABC transporter [Litorimonas cladophorae]|uniref:ABC transporter n=1 Tax=Litorimonas cladophorae TaxID=1220491 RepID=A0A918NHD3_9PROT|nr:peptidase domain-containing ABC transporter [Litorimonas cladophorae]GGX67804.1 ABC transporter [Litorimonas cladophorae]
MAKLNRGKLPVILQTEMTECGLACLAMIARYHGHDIDLNVLRRKHLVSMTGASLKSVIAIADGLQLSSRPLRVDLDHLKKLQLPAMLHWDLNHYVVLKSIKGEMAEIVDPGVGLRKIRLSQLSDHFTGIAVEFTPQADFKAVQARIKPRISLLWSRLIGLKRAVVQILILSVILQAIVLLSPFYLQLVVDAVLPRGDHALLLALAIGFGGLVILRAVSEAVRGWAILVYGNQMSLQMVGNVFGHLIRLPARYFERRHVGDIISRMGSTVPIQEALTQSVPAVLIDGAMAVLMLVVMFAYSPLLGAIVLASVLGLILATWQIYPHLRRTQEGSIYAKALENSHVIESIRAITTVKMFGREAEREAAWRNLYTDFINANVGYGKWVVARKFFETLMTGIQVVGVVWAAVTLMLGDGLTAGEGGFTLGMLVAFLAYRQYFTDAVVQLLEKGIEFNLLSLHLDRLSDIIFEETDASQSGDATLDSLQGRVTLEDVSFRYSETDPLVISDFNLDIAAGEMVTLTGPSGGGKTTLMKMMLGLYAPVKGTLRIDEQDLQTIDMADWRSRIGVVMQDDRLLSGTLADNISFFDPQIDMQRVYRAAMSAQIHETIAALPMNYQLQIGDMGSVLSGGQRQRVLLARALYQDPKVLFLDEGTANLDVETESAIVGIIRDLPITRIIVAHRPAFLEASDRVIRIG